MSLHLLGISRSRDIPRVTFPAASALPAGANGDCAGAGPAKARNGLRWVPSGELAGAVVKSLSAPLEPILHARVLAAIHRKICVLPVRFGTVMADDHEVEALLEAHHEDLLRRLDYLEAMCEIGLRISLAPRTPRDGGVLASASASRAPSTPAAVYLAQRRTQYQSQDSLEHHAQVVIQGFLQALGGLYRDWRRLTPAKPGLVRLAFLVDKDHVRGFQKHVETLALARGGHRCCTLLGPWPPYSFV